MFRLFKREEIGEPIRLIFKCGHAYDNPSPPKMSEEDLRAALRQASRIPCWECSPMIHVANEREGTYSDLANAKRCLKGKVTPVYDE